MSHRFVTAMIAVLLLAVSLIFVPAEAQAEGETAEELQATANQLMDEVRERVEEYNEAMARVEDLEAQITESEQAISEIEGKLPEEKRRAAASIKNLYKMSQDDAGLLGLILCSEDFESFVANIQYLNSVTDYYGERVGTLIDTERDLEVAKATLEEQKRQADAEEQEANDALLEAQDAADRAQAAADAALAAEQARAAAIAAYGGGFTQASSPEEAVAATNALAEQAGIQMSSGTEEAGEGRDAFVSYWAARIDAYLAGRPLAGQGTTFAEAAWDNGIDPRWSVATSMVESGGGAACFASYNAYGWLAHGAFSSWEEGISDHAAYLRGTYGTSPTPAAAALYLVGDPSALEESNDYYLSLMGEIAKI